MADHELGEADASGTSAPRSGEALIVHMSRR